ncbi:hypothetical protein GLAREA_01513 [Glarea lozoyensis ATCC 20868]|uniref:Uncharacterized protein n=1 Tax=Glarea lozoyensis (strain ATCC 20868 / MF5171) TaxID=1116229 RepID=S3D0N5_GLAL2|nr:uncharacterized protein GLAREA_01513 [Glarea lozoyensis ATCC 20868]EPE25601.1 hypothetical protein GLAREA_01513 [Glarea lozoyensis ATCC 20868]
MSSSQPRTYLLTNLYYHDAQQRLDTPKTRRKHAENTPKYFVRFECGPWVDDDF